MARLRNELTAKCRDAGEGLNAGREPWLAAAGLPGSLKVATVNGVLTPSLAETDVPVRV